MDTSGSKRAQAPEDGFWYATYTECAFQFYYKIWLEFGQTTLSGNGWDMHGEFTVAGTWSKPASAIEFTKKYASSTVPDVLHKGTFTNEFRIIGDIVKDHTLGFVIVRMMSGVKLDPPHVITFNASEIEHGYLELAYSARVDEYTRVTNDGQEMRDFLSWRFGACGIGEWGRVASYAGVSQLDGNTVGNKGHLCWLFDSRGLAVESLDLTVSWLTQHGGHVKWCVWLSNGQIIDVTSQVEENRDDATGHSNIHLSDLGNASKVALLLNFWCDVTCLSPSHDECVMIFPHKEGATDWPAYQFQVKIKSVEPDAWQSRHADNNAAIVNVFDNQGLIPFDVMFQFTGENDKVETIGAHKFMLSLRSPAFHTMITAEQEKADPENPEMYMHNISDMDAGTFRELMRYIYVGSVDMSDIKATLKLKAAAERYAMNTLAIACYENVGLNLTVANVCVVFGHAYETEDGKLQAICRQYLRHSKAQVIRATEGYSELTPEMKARLLDDGVFD